MDEWMERGSHAIVAEGKVWLIDPVDAPDAIKQAEALGEIVGVIQLLDRHPRACKALAKRYGVPLHRLPDELPGTPFQVLTVFRAKHWDERALWWPETGTLIVAELVGTNDYYALSKNQVGVHPMLRATSKVIGDDLPVKHLLVGHGAPVHDHAAESLVAAYRTRLRDLLKLPKGLRAFRKR
jgi:hypothetical protein